jgi:hypothetical protein
VALYAISFDYNGGTYISQLRASSPTTAIERWAEQVDNKSDSINMNGKGEVVRQMQVAADAPFPVAETLNGVCRQSSMRNLR